jgi:acyl carrier protein
MTVEDYSQTVQPKLQGAWNLHNIAIEEKASLDFFTMLSSISGVVGQKGQANYAAANAFLDSFACYRISQGLPACAIDLGAVEDIGYLGEHSDILAAFDSTTLTPINETLFLKIMRRSILHQIHPDLSSSDGATAQMITSIAVPQPSNSYLMADARFRGLSFGNEETTGSKSDGKTKAIQSLLMMVKAGGTTTDLGGVVQAAVEILNQQFTAILRLDEPMEPAKPLSSYGLDSLAAVELRNWVRTQLGAEITVLDITNAVSLVALAEKVAGKLATKLVVKPDAK